MAIGAAAINNSVNLANITVPTLLLAGEKDRNTLPANTTAAFNAIPETTDKRQIDILDATHRTFDSTYCDQLQSAAAAFDTDHDGRVDATEAAATNRPLDRWNIGLIGASFPGHLSGKAVHYCSAEELTTPVNIRRALASWPNAEYGCPLDTRPESDAECGWIPHTLTPPTNQPGVCRTDVTTPPCTTLSADDLKPRVVNEAVAFFGPRLYGTTPPELTVPADFSINATGPSGATVPFTVTAADDLDPDPTVTCTPPSGSVFAMGPTTVTCVATDNGGNATEKTFTVTVLDAKAQLSNLIAEVVGSTGLPRSVKTQLTAALQSLLTGFDPARPLHRAAACLSLRTFTTIVRALAPAQAAAWTADANRIRAVLAC
jgi:hypothetical protein